MSTFDERENAFENKFAHDAEMQFKADARRNKLLGLWAAELLGKSGSDAEDYAKEFIASDFDEPGDDDVLRKVLADLEKAKVDISEHRLRKKMDELREVAKHAVMTE